MGKIQRQRATPSLLLLLLLSFTTADFGNFSSADQASSHFNYFQTIRFYDAIHNVSKSFTNDVTFDTLQLWNKYSRFFYVISMLIVQKSLFLPPPLSLSLSVASLIYIRHTLQIMLFYNNSYKNGTLFIKLLVLKGEEFRCHTIHLQLQETSKYWSERFRIT